MSPEALLEIRHERTPLKALTSLRFLAAMYVVMYHVELRGGLTTFHPLSNFFNSGYTGVTLFFVLSGFVLTYNYRTVGSRKSFWIARFARVYPAYLLAALFDLCRPVNWRIPYALERSVAALLLVQGWWPGFTDALNRFGWTVSVEAFFYLAFPFLLPLMLKMRVSVFVWIQALWILITISPVLLAYSGHRDTAILLSGILESHAPLLRLYPFLTGMFVCANWLNRQQAPKPEAEISDKYRRITWIGIGACAFVLCTHWEPIFLPLRTTVLTYLFGLLILGLSVGRWRFFTSHWLQVGGEISYGIYILQSPVYFTCLGLLRRMRPGASVSEVFYVILLIAVAYASFRWLETPARLLIRRKFSGERVVTRPVV